MPFQDMVKLNESDTPTWEKQIVQKVVGNSDWVFIPFDISKVSYTLSFDDNAGGGLGSGSATGKVQTTSDLKENVLNGSDISALDWAYGDILNQSDSQDGTSGEVTAFRVVMTGGTGRAILKVRAK